MTLAYTAHPVAHTSTLTALCDSCGDGMYLDTSIDRPADAVLHLARLGWHVEGPSYAPGTATCPNHRRDSVTDRTLHAALGSRELVRYDRSGKWYVETFTTLGARIGAREPRTVAAAASEAIYMSSQGGQVFLGRPGGARFDALVRKAREATT